MNIKELIEILESFRREFPVVKFEKSPGETGYEFLSFSKEKEIQSKFYTIFYSILDKANHELEGKNYLDRTAQNNQNNIKIINRFKLLLNYANPIVNNKYNNYIITAGKKEKLNKERIKNLENFLNKPFNDFLFEKIKELTSDNMKDLFDRKLNTIKDKLITVLINYLKPTKD